MNYLSPSLRRLFVCSLASLMALIVFKNIHATGKEEPSLPRIPNGKPFRISDHVGKYVALHFLLETECPVCQRHTQTYWKRSKELPEVVQIFIKPDSAGEIQSWARDLQQNTPIYQDEGAKFAKEFKIPHGYHFHGKVVHYPALVLINPKGKEMFRYVGKNNGDRFEFEKLVSKIKELDQAHAR